MTQFRTNRKTGKKYPISKVGKSTAPIQTVKIINGKAYGSFGSYINEKIPQREATNLRNEGWYAEVIKEGKYHTLYRRKK